MTSPLQQKIKVTGPVVVTANRVGDGVRALDPYIAPVELAADGTPRPANLRERIRLNGPTIALPNLFGV